MSGCTGSTTDKRLTGDTNNSNIITIEDNNYSPSYIAIVKGQEVVWINSDSISHTVTSVTGEFDSGAIRPGSRFIYRFNISGPYEYYCTIHRNMVHGKISVK